MGTHERINTDRIRMAASTISSEITSFNSKKDSLVTRVNREITGNWHTPAAQEINQKFTGIKNLMENHKAILNNYNRALNNVIGEGYENTEEANKNLADQFL